MVLVLIVLAAITVFAIFTLMNKKGAPQEQEGVVREILSKNSFSIEFGNERRVVKLFGVSPASENEMMDDKIYEYLEQFVLGMRLTVKPQKVETGDIILGSLYSGAGEYVNAAIVRQGFARWSASEAPGDRELAEAQEVAKGSSLGVWNPAVRQLMEEKKRKQASAEEMSEEEFLDSGGKAEDEDK